MNRWRLRSPDCRLFQGRNDAMGYLAMTALQWATKAVIWLGQIAEEGLPW